MIKQEQALKIIESKKRRTLKKSDFNNFTSEYKALGLIIVKLSKEYINNEYHSEDGLKPYEKLFGTDLIFNPWNEKEGKKLAKLIFGKYQAPYIAEIWDMFLNSPYQDSYNRRSFRCKSSERHTVNRISYLQNMYLINNYGYGNFNIPEMIRYDVYGEMYYKDFSYLFAAYLNDKQESHTVYELIKDIFQGEDEVGGVTRAIVKGLLLTEALKNWKLVEDLLLAAQRQEGLRQIILEALDEASIGALRHFIKVVNEHNLTRFSSVVRAVDTWFGFGWEAPKSKTINKVLVDVLSYFNNNELISKALKSKNNLEIYTALWFLALEDVDKANLKAIELIKESNREKKILACMFISQTERTNSDILEYIKNNFKSHIELDFWLLHILPQNPKINIELFNDIKQYGDDLPTNGKVFNATIFSWSSYTIKPNFFYHFLVENANAEQQQILAKNISEIPSEERGNFIRKIFPNHYTWSYYYNKNDKVPKVKFSSDDWRRALAHQAIKDRNESVMGTGIRLFQSMNIETEDLPDLEALLGRKNRSLRENIIKLILVQPVKIIEQTTSNLLEAKKVDQRLGGLEILVELNEQKKMISFVEDQFLKYSTRQRISKNEEVFLEKFNKKTKEFSFENGFGAISYDNLSPIITPDLKFDKNNKVSSILSKLSLKQEFLFETFIDEEKTTKALNKLLALFEKHKNHEYEITTKEGVKEYGLLSNYIRLTQHKAYDIDDPKEKVKFLPLYEVWKDWYDTSKLNDFEILTAIYYCQNFPNHFKEDSRFGSFLRLYIPNLKGVNLVNTYVWDSVNNKILTILKLFNDAYADHYTIVQFKLDVLEDFLARLPQKLKSKVETEEWSNRKTHWCDVVEYHLFGVENIVEYLVKFSDDTKLLASKISFPNESKNISEIAKTNISSFELNTPPEWISVKLHKHAVINDDDFKYQLLVNKQLLNLTDSHKYRKAPDIITDDIPKGIFNQLKANLLSIELERGDLPTEVSHYMTEFASVEGRNYLFELLTRLGKETFHRGYYWYDLSSKKEVFSSLIKKSVPKEDETLSDFIDDAKLLKITKKKWIETAMYAPQWASWISEFLKINKLEDAVWWFQAHASEYMNAEKETIVSRYSNVDRADFLKGVIDIDWFQEVYTEVGKQNWKHLHDSAKYISTGNGHRLVKLYSAVMLGEVKIRETLAKIKDKRDKDYVKAFGLVPLSKTNKKKDLLNRYNILQDFLKESKQFGAQRQESEKNAVEIGLDNLARNAGYEDSIRFSWAMEGEAIQSIMEKSVVEIDNITVQLIVDEQGKADFKVFKDGKSQKSIPAKIKKDKRISALQKSKSYIKKQYSRTRVSLEKAMLNAEEFTIEELIIISKHPVVNAMLVKLLFFNKTKNTFGFIKDDKLVDCEGKFSEIDNSDVLLIAHSSHLYEGIVWDLYQKFAFENKLVQPFKQIFRELYILTPDEVESKTKSFRYQGHQIQPKKTVALLRSRGWTVNHDEGLQKVYHKKGFIASVYAMADWFSPADIEAPTLEHISFYSRKDYKSISLSAIDAVTYSEVMRDIDLVVSVAHVGGVDPEASYSTMQMRGVLARETARLFKADNVEVKERFILIKGKLADYNIHLGSGVVSKNGLSISIIPIHSQHRGRLFLPFIDDDPKSAEIISKMKLLSEDNKIKDPTILAQINRKS